MTTKQAATQRAAIENWYTLGDTGALIGSQCTQCSTYYFPQQTHFCRNPDCDSETFSQVELSREGTLWSYTSAHYQPPKPFVCESEPFEPFTLAAVQLEKEQMIILGQVVGGITPEDLTVGDNMELVIDTLHHSKDDTGQTLENMIWKWRPIAK